MRRGRGPPTGYPWGFILVLLLFFGFSHGQRVQDVVIGLSLSMDPRTVPTPYPPTLDPTAVTQRGVLSQRVFNALTFWRERFGNDTYTYIDKNGEETIMKVSWRYLEDHNNVTQMIENYRILSNDTSVTFLLGPIQTDFTLAAMDQWESAGKIMLSTSSASTDIIYRRSYSFSLATPSSRIFLSAIPVWQSDGVKTVAYITETVVVLYSACSEIATGIEPHGLRVIGNYTVTASTVLTPDQTADNLKAIQYMSKLRPDVLIFCTYAPSVVAGLKHAQSIGWTPKAVYTSATLPTLATEPIANFVNAISPWTPTLRLPRDAYYGSPQGFNLTYFRRFNTAPDFYAATGAIAPVVLTTAARDCADRTGDLTQQCLLDSLINVKMETFYGYIGFTLDRLSLHTTFVMQYINGVLYPVYPLAVRGDRTLIFPIPTWAERVYVTNKMFDDSNDIHIAAVALVFLLVSVVLQVLVLVIWRRELFLTFFLVGTALLYLSVFTSMGDPTDSQCITSSWLVHTGFVAIISALTLMAYRAKVITSKNTASALIARSRLLKAYAIMISGVLVLLVLLSAVAPSRAIVIENDPIRPALNHVVCANAIPQLVFYALFVLYKAIITIYACFLAWRIGQVAGHLTRTIFAFTILLFAMFIAELSRIYNQSAPRDTTYVVTVYFKILGPFVASVLLFYPRLKRLRHGDVDGDSSFGDSFSESDDSSFSEHEGGKKIELGVRTPPSAQEVVIPMTKNEQIILESLQIELEMQRAKIRELEEKIKADGGAVTPQQPSPPPQPVHKDSPKLSSQSQAGRSPHLPTLTTSTSGHSSSSSRNGSPSPSPSPSSSPPKQKKEKKKKKNKGEKGSEQSRKEKAGENKDKHDQV